MSTIIPKSRILFLSNTNDQSIIKGLEDVDCEVACVSNIDEVENLISSLKPDMVLVKQDLPGDNGIKLCNIVRKFQIFPRPLIVFLVSENKPESKIELLRSGADDIISYPISDKELGFRILAHLRRMYETHINPLSALPDSVLATKVLNNCMENINDWAVLSIDLDNLRIYNEAYGESRGDQMIKALAAVLKSVVSSDDFIAHNNSDDFIFITRHDKAEALAEEICRRFDYISPRFYSGDDAKRGYVIAVGQNGIRRRIQLVSISIGITAKNRRNFSSSLEVFQVARDMRYLAKSKNGSDWVSDRVRIAAHSSYQSDRRIRVLVVEPDASMSLLLRDTLELEGYAVEVAHTPIEAWQQLHLWRPELILMETEIPSPELDGWGLATKIKQEPELSGIWLIMSTKNPDHAKALDSGADLYLPKPFELQTLFTEIRYLLRTRLRSKITLS